MADPVTTVKHAPGGRARGACGLVRFSAGALCLWVGGTTVGAGQDAPDCDPRIDTEFRAVLAEAAETLDFRLLRYAFGPSEEQLRGLECDPEVLREILAEAGFTVYMHEGNNELRILGHLPDRSLWGRLRDRISAQAEVDLVDGQIARTSIGPTK